MIKRYLNCPILIDIVICLFLSVIIYYLRPFLRVHVNLPQMDSIFKSMDSIVKVATPLIGFLLTIVGVIVTFKNNFDSQNSTKKSDTSKSENNPNIPPETNVFSEPVSKKVQFYNGNIHREVMRVFLSAVYEFSAVVFLFLSIQSGLFTLTRFWAILFALLGFILIFIAMIRSLHIYRLFLNVHVKKSK